MNIDKATKKKSKFAIFSVIARLFHVHEWIADDNTKMKIGNWYNKPIYQVTKKCKCGKERVVTIMDC